MTMTDQEFRIALIQGTAGLADGFVADHLCVSHPTIRRWKAGRNLPYPTMRPAIFKALEEVKNGCIADCEHCKFWNARLAQRN